MNPIPCEIIQDLLPLYEDNICSEQSKHAVEEHLKKCGHCREYLKTMQKDLPPIEPVSAEDEQKNEAAFIRQISHKLTLRKWILCGVLLVVFLILSFMENHDIHEYLKKIPLFDTRLDMESVQVEELYQLENGNLYCTIKTDTPFATISNSSILSSEHDFWESYEDGYHSITLRKSLWKQLFQPENTFTEISFIISPAETNHIEGEPPVIHKSRSFYYEGKGEEHLLIWQKGQDIEPAPDSIEQKAEQAETGQTDSYNSYNSSDSSVDEDDPVIIINQQ